MGRNQEGVSLPCSEDSSPFSEAMPVNDLLVLLLSFDVSNAQKELACTDFEVVTVFSQTKTAIFQ